MHQTGSIYKYTKINNKICTSSFVDDVTFCHDGPSGTDNASSVWTQWLSMGQHKFDSVKYTQHDSPGTAPDWAHNMLGSIALLDKYLR